MSLKKSLPILANSTALVSSFIQITLSGAILWKINDLSIAKSVSTPSSQPEKPTEKIALFPVAHEGFPFKGDAKSKVVVVEFSDFECSFCKASQSTIKALQDKYRSKVKWVARNYPISALHRGAVGAALASMCAAEQSKFWEYHDLLFNTAQGDGSLDTIVLKKAASSLRLNESKFISCLDSKKYLDFIQRDFQEGTKLGVSGTPTFFINNRILVGNQSFETFEKIIDEEIKKTSFAQ
jgi:protein-disulfide isomerase